MGRLLYSATPQGLTFSFLRTPTVMKAESVLQSQMLEYTQSGCEQGGQILYPKGKKSGVYPFRNIYCPVYTRHLTNTAVLN